MPQACISPQLLSLIASASLALAACSGDDAATTAATATEATGSTAGTDPTATATATTSPSTSTASSTSTSTSSTSESTGPTATDPTTTDPTTTGPITTGPTTTDPTTTGPTTTDPTTTTDGTTDGTTGGLCEEGTILCEDGVSMICDGMGGYSSEEACDDECAPGLGCVLCVPGDTQCDGGGVLICNNEGDAWEEGPSCDGLQGLSCDEDLGQCVGSCADLGLSYIGCDYYATVTQQYDLYNTAPKDEFAVAVANTAGQVAKVTVTRGANTVAMVDVAANSVGVIKLPWVNELTKGTGPTVKVTDGAYRVRSTNPVTIYQFNPLDSTTTNDASLLLPVNTWRDEYMAASWPNWDGINLPAWYAIVASKDGTKVTLNPSATGDKIKAGAGVAADGTGVVMLDEGDVLQVITNTGGDVTGTIAVADKPIEMFAGHDCTNVPFNKSACDHLEEAMFPIDSLAKEYIVVPPIQVPNNNLDKAQMVKIVASEDNTTLTFEPDQPVNKNLAKAGDFVMLSETTAAFKVSSDKKILVAQFMVGQTAGYGTSDPAMLLTVPAEQYRSDYLFFAATNWVANFVDIIAPTNTAVEVDQMAVNTWAPIGNTGFSVAHVPLSNAGDGSHRVTADKKVGISVYGVQSAGSYWFPGGLDLDILPQ